ncbi:MULTISPECIES: hypothetical protein [unclassified Lebetimonas]|uniref:hypothetical protein n=1 Tax=unclassified Lebetimonas TaxID=2648158 RepID=UPI00046794A4|nr:MULTISPECIES: hypothetical protein [unclassified Lebetimonas]
MEFLYSISEAFKDLKNTKMQKLSIVLGSVLAAFWIIMALWFWNRGLILTNFLISIMPFKFLQNAGSQFIIMIVWIQIILASLGIIYSLFGRFFKNIFSSIALVSIITFFWTFVFFVYHSAISGYVKNLLRIFPYQSIEEAVSNILLAFMFYSFYIAAFYFIFLIFSVKILEEIKEGQYPQVDTKKEFNLLKIIFINIRDFLIFLFGMIIFYPLMFVPFVNILIIVFLWAVLIKESLLQSVFMLFGKEEIDKKKIWAFCILSVILNFIPVLNFYAPAFGILSIFHYVMEKKEDRLNLA